MANTTEDQDSELQFHIPELPEMHYVTQLKAIDPGDRIMALATEIENLSDDMERYNNIKTELESKEPTSFIGKLFASTIGTYYYRVERNQDNISATNEKQETLRNICSNHADELFAGADLTQQFDESRTCEDVLRGFLSRQELHSMKEAMKSATVETEKGNEAQEGSWVSAVQGMDNKRRAHDEKVKNEMEQKKEFSGAGAGVFR